MGAVAIYQRKGASYHPLVDWRPAEGGMRCNAKKEALQVPPSTVISYHFIEKLDAAHDCLGCPRIVISLNPCVGEILDGPRQEDVSGDGVRDHRRLRLVVDVAHAAEADVRHVQDLQEVVAL